MTQERYGFGDVIGDVAKNVAQSIDHHNKLPPREKNLARAGGGAGLIAGCTYTAAVYIPTFGSHFAAVAQHFLSDPLDAPRSLQISVAAWSAVLGFGLLWFYVGVRGSRGPRDVMATFWAMVRAGIWAALLGWKIYLPSDWGTWITLGNLIIRGFYIAALVESLTFLVLLLRGRGTSAAALVAKQIQQTTVAWRTGARPKF